MKQERPEQWKFIDKVWQVRKAHAVPNLPSQYIFLLKCCNHDGCEHPLCVQKVDFRPWFPCGPPLDYIPLPIVDQSLPWGTLNAQSAVVKYVMDIF